MTFFADFTSGQSNVSYTRMRQLLATSGGGLQEGVVGAGDLKVSQRGAGANMSVDLAVGDAWIQYDTGSRNGLSHVWSDAIANVVFNASDATNPRIDQVGIQLNDTSVGAGTGGNTPAPRYLPGTATAGATLDNRTGAAALPNDCLRLADILVPATSTTVTTANIRDRRPWARGALAVGARTTTLTLSATLGELDTTNWKARVECSGVPLRLTLAPAQATVIAAGTVNLQFWVDGAIPVAAPSIYSLSIGNNTATNLNLDGVFTTTFVPAAGSHLLSVAGQYQTSASACSLGPSVFTVEEIVRPNASNT